MELTYLEMRSEGDVKGQMVGWKQFCYSTPINKIKPTV